MANRYLPTSPGRYYGRWGSHDWRWFDVTHLHDDPSRPLVTQWDGQTWYVTNIYFDWKEQPTTDDGDDHAS